MYKRQLITQEAAKQLRTAALLVDQVPWACMEPIGLEFFTLNPGERAVVPVLWQSRGDGKVLQCSTHPEAPTGLAVLPGPCDAGESMSLVVENASGLPITISEKDVLAAGVEEGELPTLEACAAVQDQQEKFCQALDWSGGSKDEERIVASPNDDQSIVVMIHKVPRFAACSEKELSDCLLYTSPSPRD